MSGNNALITGASRGLGRELAHVFAENGFNLFLAARRSDQLASLACELAGKYNITAEIISVDLNEPESPRQIYNFIASKNIEIHVLVNNCGIGQFGAFNNADITQVVSLININILSLTKLCRLFLENMLKNNYGKILNVASMAALRPGPGMAVYFATKAYVLSFSRSLHYELLHKNITVSAFCPGALPTEFASEVSVSFKPVDYLNNKKIIKNAALAAYKGLMRRKTVIVYGAINRLTAFLFKILPEIIYKYIFMH
ncbi:MAG: hypothetical protein A2096_16600 [Spirochaetes bacterium GWF1_41_5]|nr:MAG: hypothetical protein A2096_16600 [Spirochaetes bacterium GWF1_41_5]HBE04049.1 short-chain dehydrogenase [Spirochaetia bacterium]